MTVLRWSIVIMPVGALLASTAMAQTNTSSYVQQPGSIQQMAFQQDDGFALAAGTTALPASPSNLPAAPAASASPPRRTSRRYPLWAAPLAPRQHRGPAPLTFGCLHLTRTKRRSIAVFVLMTA